MGKRDLLAPFQCGTYLSGASSVAEAEFRYFIKRLRGKTHSRHVSSNEDESVTPAQVSRHIIKASIDSGPTPEWFTAEVAGAIYIRASKRILNRD